jgi:hypothetical protein
MMRKLLPKFGNDKQGIKVYDLLKKIYGQMILQITSPFHEEKAADIQLIIRLLANYVGLFKNNIACFYLCKLGHEDGFYTVTQSAFDHSQQERVLNNFI